jgi:cytochrome c553
MGVRIAPTPMEVRMRIAVGTKVLAAFALGAAAVAGLSCASSAPTAPPIPWQDMPHEDRVAHMKHVVLPGMKLEFEAWKSDEFAEMTCATCHGEGARDETFKMPNPDLPKLPGVPNGFEKLMAEDPDAAEFMAKVVVPKMAAMLGEQPYGPTARNGFGCFRCHTTK